jgi:hypothetical protein
MFEMQPKYLGFEAEPNPAKFEVAQDGNVASDCKFMSGPILKPHSLMTMVTSTISYRPEYQNLWQRQREQKDDDIF